MTNAEIWSYSERLLPTIRIAVEENIMRKHAILLLILTGVLLLACGSKFDASEKNFSAALNQYFDEKGQLCLNIKEWPVELAEPDELLKGLWTFAIVPQMEALQAAGLVKAETIEVARIGFLERTSASTKKITRYSLTPAARPYIHEQDRESVDKKGAASMHQADLCWGKKVLDRIVKWVGPRKFGDYQEAAVIYTYRINDTANWANHPAIQNAFPDIRRIIKGVGKSQETHGVRLTSLGWEANGLDIAR